MSYYLIESLESVTLEAPDCPEPNVYGPFKSKKKAFRWLMEDAKQSYEGQDGYEFDSELKDQDFSSKWGLVKLESTLKPVFTAKISVAIDEESE